MTGAAAPMRNGGARFLLRVLFLLLVLNVFSPCVFAASAPATVVTYNPVLLPYAAEDKTLALRISLPAAGSKIPLILFSHGAQYSKDDYLPLTEFWAAHGYAVIQPTHLESRSLALPKDDPHLKDVWRSRAEDMRFILDSLGTLTKLVPALKDRIDTTRVYAVGHSFGGHTASLLIGAHVNGQPGDLTDPRIRAAVLMSPPGFGKNFLDVSWDALKAPMLLITGDQDLTPGVNDAWEYHADPYFKSAAGGTPKCLAVMAGMKHYLGGILGTNRTEEKNPDAASVQAIQAMTLDFLEGRKISADGKTVGRTECK